MIVRFIDLQRWRRRKRRAAGVIDNSKTVIVKPLRSLRVERHEKVAMVILVLILVFFALSWLR